jgi:hypothetical protein
MTRYTASTITDAALDALYRQVADIRRIAGDALIGILDPASCPQCGDTGACAGGPCPLVSASTGPVDAEVQQLREQLAETKRLGERWMQRADAAERRAKEQERRADWTEAEAEEQRRRLAAIHALPADTPWSDLTEYAARVLTRSGERILAAEQRAAAMERAMESTAADASAHRFCHMRLMAQCRRAEQAEAERDRLREELAVARSGMEHYRNGRDAAEERAAEYRRNLDGAVETGRSNYRAAMDARAALDRVHALAREWLLAGPPKPLSGTSARIWAAINGTETTPAPAAGTTPSQSLAAASVTACIKQNVAPAATGATEQPAPRHTGLGANAEDCPACCAAPTPPPYPFICPGEVEP